MKTTIHKWDRCIAGMLISALLLLNGCDDNSTGSNKNDEITPSYPTQTIFETIQTRSDLSTFEELLKVTNIENTLDGESILTIFAPSNSAFEKLSSGYLENFTKEQKIDLINYLILSGVYKFGTDNLNESVATLQGGMLHVVYSQSSGARLNNKAQVITKNIDAKNGFIHIIDEVLIPEKVQIPEPIAGTLFEKISGMDGYENFVRSLVTAGLSDFLQTPGQKTLLPNPDNFLVSYESNYGRPFSEEEWKEIMQYHLLDQNIAEFPIGSRNTLATLSGDSLYIYRAPGCFVINMNSFAECGWGAPEFILKSSNGSIISGMGYVFPDKFRPITYIIDKRHHLRNFIDNYTAEVSNRLHNGFGLGDPDEKFTVFVPSDNASGWNHLPNNENDITELLKYHILLEPFTAEQLQDNQAYTTWQGAPIHITKNGDKIIINGSAVIAQTNLIGTNGVVHIIDRILKPTY